MQRCSNFAVSRTVQLCRIPSANSTAVAELRVRTTAPRVALSAAATAAAACNRPGATDALRQQRSAGLFHLRRMMRVFVGGGGNGGLTERQVLFLRAAARLARAAVCRRRGLSTDDAISGRITSFRTFNPPAPEIRIHNVGILTSSCFGRTNAGRLLRSRGYNCTSSAHE
jgi:hypothetical protein